MNDLFDKEHVKNHKWFKNLKADSAAKEKRIAKHAQSLDLGDSTGKPNLSDMFSSANRLGLLNNSKKLPDLIKTAILTAREVIDQFDFPISPAITYLGVKNVKTAGTTDDVLSGTIVLMCKFATVGGLKQSFDVPVQVVSGKVLPPSVIKFNGRDIVLAQSSVNAMVQRASSYELIPVRKQFSAPLTRDERESATELRNEIGYQAREGIGPVSTIRRTYKKAYFGSASAVAEQIGGEIVGYMQYNIENDIELDWTDLANFIGSKFEDLDPIDLANGLEYYNKFAETPKHVKEGFPFISDEDQTTYFGVDPRQIGVVSDLDKDAESDLTDKITPNEPMADMDDAKKFQNEPLRARKAQNDSYAVEVIDTINDEEQGGKVVNHVFAIGEEKARKQFDKYVDKYVTNRGEEGRYVVQLLDPSGEIIVDTQGSGGTNRDFQNTKEDSDLNLNHFAKKAQEDDESLLRDVDIDGYRLQMWDNGEKYERGQRRNYIRYSFTDPQGNVVFSGEDYSPSPMHAIDSDESVRGLLGYLTLRPGDTDDEYFEKYTDEQKSFADSAAEGLSMWGMDPQDDDEDDFYHTFKDWSGGHQASRVASMGTAIPGGYAKVKELMDKAQDDGKDTFPRSWIHVLRNYILEVVSTASQDSWATHLVNDGYVLNPYGSNNRGREKTAQFWEGEAKEFYENQRMKDYPKEPKFQLGDKVIVWPSESNSWEGTISYMHSWDDYAETYNYKVNGRDENGEQTGKRLTVPEGSMEKIAQAEDEWNDELVMDESDAHIYDGTKTPCEPGDSVKFQGHEGAIRGTIVEVNKAAGNAIVKAKGYEYRVALEDIQPLNSTFKKMYANSCLRILPPEPKYAQIFNNMEKNPSIDNPWAATWDARDKDLHSGPPEIKNKDVKPILKGIGKKSQASSRSWEKSDAGDNARGRDHFAHPKRITINISHLAAGDWEDQEEQFLTYWRDAIDGFIFVDPGMEIPGWPEETSVLIKITESDDSIKLFGFEAEEEMSLKAELEGTVEAAWEWASRTFGN